MELGKLRLGTLSQINQGKDRTFSFDVDFTEEIEGFKGTFTVHQPTQLERIRMGVIRSGITQGQPLDVIADNLVTIVSTLEVVLDKYPEWFTLDNPDVSYEMLYHIYEQYANWVSDFRRPNKAE